MSRRPEKAMNELHFASRIRQILNQGAVRPTVAQRLQGARELALSRQRPEPQTVMRWADNVLGDSWSWGGLSARVLLPVLALVVATFGIYRWQESQRLAEVVEMGPM